MNINEIMNRDIEAARRETERGWEARRLAELTARREKIAKAINAAVLATIIILGLVAAFVAGRAYTIKQDLKQAQAAWATERVNY